MSGCTEAPQTEELDESTHSEEVSEHHLGYEGEEGPETYSLKNETPDTESVAGELKLIKKIGPVEFPPFGDTVDVQVEDIKIEEARIFVTTDSVRRGDVTATEVTPEKHVVILLLLRDERGNVIESLCKIDKETGSFYFLRSSFDRHRAINEMGYAVPLKEQYGIKTVEILKKYTVGRY